MVENIPIFGRRYTNMKKLLLVALWTAFSATPAASVPSDSLQGMNLKEVEVVSTPKESGILRLQPVASTSIGHLRERHITTLKDASTLVPNLFIPNYGSRITSAVYVRGVGSRSGTSAVAMYVDNVPYTDKSAFDFNFFDVERVDVLRGPQATLYGRNAMGGIVKVHTKNPFRYQGTDIHLGRSTADNRYTASVAHYHRVSDKFAFSSTGYVEGNDGVFKNTTTGNEADNLMAGGGRMRGIIVPTDRLHIDLSVNYDHSNQRAYPYYYEGAAAGTEEQYDSLRGSISNNRNNTYRRSLLNVGANIEYRGEDWMLTSITGYQRLSDRMFMDQDFLKADIYTLLQKQRMHSLNEELIVRSTKTGKYQWLNGLNLMYQHMRTKSGVTFFNDGLRWLESNINANMPQITGNPQMAVMQAMGFESMAVNFRGSTMPMNGSYNTPTMEAALFHQSTWKPTERWTLTLGARLDFERQNLSYLSPATANYGFTLTNNRNPLMGVNLQNLSDNILYEGSMHQNQWGLLPRLAAQYNLDENNNLYATATFGQRSGGYNIQMFSDLLQGAMSVDMMKGIKEGVYRYMQNLSANNPNMPQQVPDPDKPGEMIALPDYVHRVMDKNMPIFEYPNIEQLRYDPETSWNFEVGAHLMPSHRFTIDAALFYSFIQDQQLSRFANSGMGRMMVNSGKTRSWGAELSTHYRPIDALSLRANYGFTHATFKEYNDGRNNFKGNYVPFVPAHTLSGEAMYTFELKNDKLHTLSLAVNTQGHGRMFWTEDNTLSQTFKATLGARALLKTNWGDISLWGKNLTNHRFHTFRFVSANRIYHQRNLPLQVGADITVRL